MSAYADANGVARTNANTDADADAHASKDATEKTSTDALDASGHADPTTAGQVNGLFTIANEDEEGEDPNGDGDGTDGDEVGEKDDSGPGTGQGHASEAAPHAKAAGQSKPAKGGKSGNQGNFQGEPLIFLQSLLKDYIALQAQARDRGKLDRLNAFWTRMRKAFWAKFEWTQFCDTFKEKDEARLRTKVNQVSFR